MDLKKIICLAKKGRHSAAKLMRSHVTMFRFRIKLLNLQKTKKIVVSYNDPERLTSANPYETILWIH